MSSNQSIVQIIEHGYINVYSQLNEKERRQLEFNRKFKRRVQDWDATYVRMVKIFRDFCTGYGKGVKLLDAGCGNGNYIVDECHDLIDQAIGMDVDPKFVEKNISMDKIVIGNLEKLPFEDQSFDAVISLWVFEHLENPEKVMKEIKRVLVPGGLILFVTPNKNCLLVRTKRLLERLNITNSINSWLYGREEKDIFKTYYRANSLEEIKALGKFTCELNYDPGYTSFEPISFAISVWLYKFFAKVNPGLYNQHLIGYGWKTHS